MHKKVKVFKNIQNKYGKVNISKRLKQNRKKQKAQKENIAIENKVDLTHL